MSLVSPFKKWNCFSCGKEIHLGTCKIYNYDTKQEILEESPDWWPGGLQTIWQLWCKMRSPFYIEPLDGRRSVQTFATRQCPHCKRYLPPNMETARNIVIAVLGDRTVGKSHYIAACVDHLTSGELEHNFAEIDSIDALNIDIEEKYLDIYNQFFKNHAQLPVTPSVTIARSDDEKLNDPLIYTLKVRKDPFPAKYVNIIIYDASGEDLAKLATLVKFKAYALDPDAIICIVDPLTIPGIESRTPYKKDSDLEPDTILRRTIDRIEHYNRLRGEKLKIPIAITLSKSDVLTYLVSGGVNYKYLEQASYAGGFDLEDIAAVAQEVKDLLDKYGAYRLLSAEKRSENVSFFATSATGCAPDPDTGKFPKVEPRRCLDPLLWILFTLGVISKKEEKVIQNAASKRLLN